MTSILLMVLGACSGDKESKGESNEGKSKSELKIAYDTNPPTLDPHMSTAFSTMDFTAPIFESLLAMNSNYEPVPMLAESYDISEDEKVITFNLRQGIKFHNGKEMIAEDVIASMNRWKEKSIMGKANLSDANFVEVDNYTVELQLENPSPLILSVVGNPMQFAGIMPKEVIDSAPVEGVSEFIGTGPYQVEEWVESQSLHLKKFEDYSALTTPADGLSGKKEALVDDIYMDIVTDSTTRTSGLQTGQYDISLNLPYDNAAQIESNDKIKTLTKDYGFIGLFFNKQEGVFEDIKTRQAVNAALNMEEILMAAYTDPKYFSYEHALASEDQKLWYTDAGKEQYNQHDIEKAKKILAESDYNGEEITFLVTRAYETHYNAAVVIQKQLEKIGMNVKLDVYDWATLLEHRSNPEAWDLFGSGFIFEATPINYVFLHSENEYAGWTNSPEMDQLIDQIKVTPTEEERLELFEELQEEVWNYLPYIRYGNYKPLHAMQNDVEGFDTFTNILLWNVDKK